MKTQREKFEEWASQYDYDLTWSKLIDNYNFSVTRILFDTWQAAIESVVVELPRNGEAIFDNDFAHGCASGAAIYRVAIEQALDKAGIKYK